MKKLLASLLCVVAIAFAALIPSKASAGWGWWGGPGISMYIGPRYGYPYYGYYGYGYHPYYGYPTDITVIAPTDITAIGTTGTGTGRAMRIADGTDRSSLLQR